MTETPLQGYRIDMKYVSGEKFAAREQCLNFKRMEIKYKKFVEKKK